MSNRMCVRVGSLILQLEEMGRTFLYYFFSVAFLCPCIRFGASMRRRRLTATCSVLPSPRGPEAHTALVGVPPESRPFFAPARGHPFIFRISNLAIHRLCLFLLITPLPTQHPHQVRGHHRPLPRQGVRHRLERLALDGGVFLCR